ncbi:MAG: hypothetical protein ACYCV4_05370, partial [Dermatophilaceae bacterium]
MTTELEPVSAETALEHLVTSGDLRDFTPAERVAYYNGLCRSLDLNPMTRPFEYIVLSGKLTLYARKDAAEQLRRRDQISIRITARDLHEHAGVYVVTAQATTPAGRTDEAIGAVPLPKGGGEALANAIMKAETKAKRRVTLSICGLGMLDESEVDSVPGAVRADVDAEGNLYQPAQAIPNAINGERAVKAAEWKTRMFEEARSVLLANGDVAG